jgi:hypothetical protein
MLIFAAETTKNQTYGKELSTQILLGNCSLTDFLRQGRVARL